MKIVLQAGHCHRLTSSTGTRSAKGFTEQQFTWPVANRARELLAADGHQAVVILADVPSSAYRGDVFVAIHADGSGSTSAKGASVGYRTDQGKALAAAWKAAYKALGWDHGFRGDNYTAALGGYYGVKRAVEQGNRRACIIEAGFLTNPAEAAELASPAGQERCAQAIRRAVNAIFGLPSNTTPTPQEDDDMSPELEEKLNEMNLRLIALQEVTERLEEKADGLPAKVTELRDTLASLVRRVTGTKTVADKVKQQRLDQDTGAAIQKAIGPSS